MAFEIGLAIVIAVTVAMILLRVFFKAAFKVISIIWFVCFLGAMAFTVLIYMDASDIRKNFAESDNLYLLESEGEILAGFVTKGAVEPEMLSSLDEIIKKYESSDFAGILAGGKYYKMITINEKSLEGLGEIDLVQLKISAEDAFRIIKSEEAAEDYRQLLAEKNFTDEGAESSNAEKVKGLMFYFLYSQASIEQGPMFLVDNIKSGLVKVYEETLVFKIIKRFPTSMVKNMIKNGGSS